jgi:hypothetical protein
MTNSGGWAVLVANNNSAVSLSSLGLTAGQTYTFSQDMKVFSGNNIGGFKIDFVPSGSSGEKYNAKIGDGSTWETYNFSVLIPAGTTGIKVVPLWGGDSSVGFDNIRVENGAVPLVPGIPNPGFEVLNGASWSPVFGGGSTTFTYPTTGGNPGGYGVMTNNGGWGIWVANGNTPLTLGQLSLTAGQTYNFSVDMKIFSGTNLGKLKLEYAEGGDSGEMSATKVGDGTSWATYTFPVTIPAGKTALKIVPVAGGNSSVGFDNFAVASPPPPLPPQASIASATKVSWTPLSTVNSYQPQKSVDGVVYSNMGSAVIGNGVSSAFEVGKSAFYRVMESTPGTQEGVFNGGFEDEGVLASEADGWLGNQSQPAVRITSDFRTGTACMRLSVLNVGAAPNGSELSQDIINAGGEITTGSSYTLTFWAKQISSGPSYVQEYRVSWLAAGGAEVVAGGWQNLPSNSLGVWTQKTLTGLVAPAGAVTAFIQIVGKTGAVEGGFGEVLIDDVSLAASGFSSPTLITSSTTPAVQISWPSTTGKSTRVQSSTDLSSWTNFSSVVVGDNTVKAVYDTVEGAKKFYKVGELP